MNAEKFHRLGVPLGEAMRRVRERGIYSASPCKVVRRSKTLVPAGIRELKRRERRAPFAKRLTEV